MKRFGEREVARMLAPDGTPRPPVDLATRIKDEIPAEVRLDPDALARMGVYHAGAHQRFYREFVLLAAMLLVVVGLGLWGLKVVRDHEDAARQARAIEALLEDKADAAKTASPEANPAPAGRAIPVTAPAAPSSPPSTPAAARRDDWGRGAASLTVAVHDEDGVALGGAKVVLRRIDPPGLGSREAIANLTGQVRFLDLPAGGYLVHAGLPGFEPKSLGTVMVAEGCPAAVSLALAFTSRTPASPPR